MSSRNVQVRDVPESVHAELARQAAAAGMSLNRFMLAEFERIARRGRNAEVFRAAAARQGGRVSSEEIVEALRAGREER
jgi:23S rRNA maturation mini-RNase III